MNIAIITARGGSKRIPHKNIKAFCGKPILLYPIQAALESGLYDEVMVSTDDPEIARIAAGAGAKVPFMRSEAASNDFASTADVLTEVLQEYQKRGKEFETMTCLYPTAPFVNAKKLRRAMELLESQNADSVIPVVAFSYPPQRGMVVDNGLLKMKWLEYLKSRSQDLEPFYHDAGQFYVMRVSSFLQQRLLLMERTVPLFVPELEAQDIDNESDWKLAEIKFQYGEKTFYERQKPEADRIGI